MGSVGIWGSVLIIASGSGFLGSSTLAGSSILAGSGSSAFSGTGICSSSFGRSTRLT